MQEIQFNPVRDIKTALEAAKEQDEEDKCPECFDNQLKWFCSAVVPKCGTFRASIETTVLPALTKVTPVSKHRTRRQHLLACENPQQP